MCYAVLYSWAYDHPGLKSFEFFQANAHDLFNSTWEETFQKARQPQ